MPGVVRRAPARAAAAADELPRRGAHRSPRPGRAGHLLAGAVSRGQPNGSRPLAVTTGADFGRNSNELLLVWSPAHPPEEVSNAYLQGLRSSYLAFAMPVALGAQGRGRGDKEGIRRGICRLQASAGFGPTDGHPGINHHRQTAAKPSESPRAIDRRASSMAAMTIAGDDDRWDDRRDRDDRRDNDPRDRDDDRDLTWIDRSRFARPNPLRGIPDGRSYPGRAPEPMCEHLQCGQ